MPKEEMACLLLGNPYIFGIFPILNGRERRSTSLAVRELVDSAVTMKRRGTL